MPYRKVSYLEQCWYLLFYKILDIIKWEKIIMGLNKVTYTDKYTPILAKNLNDIQDKLIDLEDSLSETQATLQNMQPKLEFVSYTMSVGVSGELSINTNTNEDPMPTPSELKRDMLDNGRFVYIKLYDRYWLDGQMDPNGLMSIVYLPYTQRNFFTGDTFCTFEADAYAPVTGILYHVRIKGVEANNTVTWTIEKTRLSAN